jgi:hypothetical protein
LLIFVLYKRQTSKMAMDQKSLVYNIEKAVGINKRIQNTGQELLAITDPLKYNEAYKAKLAEVKKNGEEYVLSQLKNYATSGLDQDQINRLVGEEAVGKYRIEMNAVDTLFPYRSQSIAQIAKNKASRISLGRKADVDMVDVDKKKRTYKKRAAPKEKKTVTKKRAAPKEKKVTKRRKTTK